MPDPPAPLSPAASGMTVVALAAPGGGVGCTVATLALTTGLLALGRRVVVLDALPDGASALQGPDPLLAGWDAALRARAARGGGGTGASGASGASGVAPVAALETARDPGELDDRLAHAEARGVEVTVVDAGRVHAAAARAAGRAASLAVVPFGSPMGAVAAAEIAGGGDGLPDGARTAGLVCAPPWGRAVTMRRPARCARSSRPRPMARPRFAPRCPAPRSWSRPSPPARCRPRPRDSTPRRSPRALRPRPRAPPASARRGAARAGTLARRAARARRGLGRLPRARGVDLLGRRGPRPRPPAPASGRRREPTLAPRAAGAARPRELSHARAVVPDRPLRPGLRRGRPPAPGSRAARSTRRAGRAPTSAPRRSCGCAAGALTGERSRSASPARC